MSTKIYTGLAFTGLSAVKALALLSAERPALEALANRKHCKVLAERLTEMMDSYTLHRQSQLKENEHWQALDNETPFLHCHRILKGAQEQCRGGASRAPAVDCDVELALWVHPRNGRLLALVQEEGVGARDYLLSVPGIASYNYWNNTDRPAEVSSQAWAARNRQWTAAVDGGIRVSLRIEPTGGWGSELTPFLPSLEDRVSQRARRFVQNTYLKKHWTPSPNASLSGVMRLMRLVDEQLVEPSSELSSQFTSRQELLRQWLAPDLSPLLYKDFKSLPVRCGDEEDASADTD